MTVRKVKNTLPFKENQKGPHPGGHCVAGLSAFGGRLTAYHKAIAAARLSGRFHHAD